MLKKITLKLPSNATTDEKVYALEELLNQFLDKKGNFDITAFSKSFQKIQEALKTYMPDWEKCINEIPLFADDFLSGKFRDILSKVNPNPIDFVDLARNTNYDISGSVRQFSSVEMNEGIPPLNTELIVFNPIVGLSIACIAESEINGLVKFKNLGVGGPFVLYKDDIKWLPAKRFNDVEYSGVNPVSIKGFSSDELSSLIKNYIKR